MGILKNLNTFEIFYLLTSHHIGRSLQNDTQINDYCVSRQHAVIRWNESSWQLIDQSKNGSIVDGKIVCQTSINLEKGATIKFGNDESDVWELTDDSPPRSFFRCINEKNSFIELNKNTVLQDINNNTVSFFKSGETKWFEDNGSEIKELINGETYYLDHKEYSFINNEIFESTIDLNTILNHSYFLFNVSADEEIVDTSIVINQLNLKIGTRVYNHMLLRLVRQKIKDETHNVDSQHKGWMSIEEMLDFLGKELLLEVDNYYLNVQIYRFRKALVNLNPYGYLFYNVIERKKGKLRFNHRLYKIIKDGELIISNIPSTEN